MEWIKRSEQEPSPLLGKILVWSECGNPHVAFYDYQEWCHTECCYESGGHFTGEGISFEYWTYVPKPPTNNLPESNELVREYTDEDIENWKWVNEGLKDG